MAGNRGRHADIAHFESLFARSKDPWGTRHRHDEAYKRQTIIRLLPPHAVGRLLELGCGNGSNSAVLARHCLRLDACDGSLSAVDLTRAELKAVPHTDAYHLVLPGRFPSGRYDAVVVSELFYYLTDNDLAAVLREIERTLRPSGRLVLCHHHRQFHDARQKQNTLHARILRYGKGLFRLDKRARTGRWEAIALYRT